MNNWESIRREWTYNHTPYSPNSRSEYAYPTDQYDSIYTCLVSGKTLKKPLKLGFIINILIHGWKSEGLFTPPPDYIHGHGTD